MLTDEETTLAFERHLTAQLGIACKISDLKRLSPGFSWTTYSFVCVRESLSRRLIARVGPENGLFAPYSVMPQVRALRTFFGTATPVPELVSYCEDGGDLGSPFFICAHVSGDVPSPWAASSLDADHRREIGEQFVHILADIHARSWQDTPLAGLTGADAPRPELDAIRRWQDVLALRTSRYYPILEWGGAWLAANCPAPPHRCIVHGDYRIGNFLEEAGRITAILDWELVHIGDPHEDLGWALMPTFNGGSRHFYGVMERPKFVDLYQSASGIDVSEKTLAFYEAYALYQAAAIQMRGVQACEIDKFPDMRLFMMSSQMASIVRAFDRALEAAA